MDENWKLVSIFEEIKIVNLFKKSRNIKRKHSFSCYYCCWITKSCQLLATPWTIARETPVSMGFSWQEYWSGLPFPSTEDFPDPGILHCSQILYHLSYREDPKADVIPIQLSKSFSLFLTRPIFSPLRRSHLSYSISHRQGRKQESYS